MVKPFAKAVCVAAMLFSLAACAGEREGRIYERVASPDGAYEAVLMLCPLGEESRELLLTGAVFRERGKACSDLVQKGWWTNFHASRATEGEAPAATIQWQDGKAVFELYGSRTLAGRSAQGDAPLDIIQLKGSFDGADIDAE